MDLGTLIVRLTADASQYNSVIGGVMSTMGEFAAIAANITGRLGKQAIELAMDFQDAVVSFGTLLGSAEKGANMVQEIQKLAVATPFQTDELLKSTQMLAGYGVAQENLLPVLKALGNVSSGTGSNIRDLARAYGQVTAAGRLMGQEKNQLINAGVSVKDLADAAGSTVPEFLRMMEAGEIGSDVVEKAFNRMTSEGGRFYDMMGARSQTARGQWTAIKETFQLTLQDVGLGMVTEMKDSGLFDVILNIIKEIRAGTSGLGMDMSGMMGHLSEIVTGIYTAAQSTVEMFKEISFGIQSVLKGLGMFEETKFIDVVAMFAALPAYAMDGWVALKGYIYDFFEEVIGFIGKMHEGVADFVKGLAEAANTLLPDALSIDVGDVGYDASFYREYKQAFKELGEEARQGLGRGDAAVTRFYESLDRLRKKGTDAKDTLDKIGGINVAPKVDQKALDMLVKMQGTFDKAENRPYDKFAKGLHDIYMATPGGGTSTGVSGFEGWFDQGGKLILSEEARQASIVSVYRDLQKGLKGWSDPRLPETALRGSLEAQNVINRSSGVGPMDLQAEIKNNLDMALKLQTEQLDVDKKTYDLLEKEYLSRKIDQMPVVKKKI